MESVGTCMTFWNKTSIDIPYTVKLVNFKNLR